jgi:hypothetical protein
LAEKISIFWWDFALDSKLTTTICCSYVRFPKWYFVVHDW